MASVTATLTTTGATAATGIALITKPITDTFCVFGISGTYGTLQIKFEVSADGTNYYPAVAQLITDGSMKTGTISPTDNLSAAYRVDGTAGFINVRLYVVAIASGSVAVTGSTSALVGNPAIATTGSLTSSSPTAKIGYSTGAGGAVTQATSKSTGVTLNTPTGAITMNNAALATLTRVSFTLTNSVIAATDVVDISIKSGATTGGTYSVVCDTVAAGSCQISVTNLSAGTLSEALVLNFALIAGAAS